MRRTWTRIVPAALLLLANPLSAASANFKMTQSVSVVGRVKVPSQFVQLCLNEECETILLPGISDELRLDLKYALASSSRLPSIATEVGTPAICELRDRDGSITRRPGVAVLASEATFSDGSSVQLSQGGKPVKHKSHPRRGPPLTESVGASVCVLTSYP